MIMAGRDYIAEEITDATKSNNKNDVDVSEEVNRILSRFTKGSELKVEDVYDMEDVEESEEARPTERTLGYYTSKSTKKVEETKAGLGLKNKILVLLYVVAVCGLIVAILVTNAKINGSMAQYNVLSEQKALIEGELAQLNAQIAELERNYDAEVKAKELGFSVPDASSRMQFSAPAIREPLTYTIDRNFFDIICDFFSGLFGG